MTEEKKYKIVWETLELMYKASVPSIDFNELCKNCKYEDYNGNLVETNGYLTREQLVEKQLRRRIPFMDYTLKESIADEIMRSQIKKYKLNKFEADGLRGNIYLGCAPKFEYDLKKK